MARENPPEPVHVGPDVTHGIGRAVDPLSGWATMMDSAMCRLDSLLCPYCESRELDANLLPWSRDAQHETGCLGLVCSGCNRTIVFRASAVRGKAHHMPNNPLGMHEGAMEKDFWCDYLNMLILYVEAAFCPRCKSLLPKRRLVAVSYLFPESGRIELTARFVCTQCTGVFSIHVNNEETDDTHAAAGPQPSL